MKPSIYLLDYFGFIKVSGKDAANFLQGQLTADINAITSSLSSLSARCTPQGRVVSVFRIFQYQDAYFLRLPLSMVQITIESLKKFAIFSKVTIEDKSSEWVAIGFMHLNESIDTSEGYITVVPGEERFEYYVPKSDFYVLWERLKSYTTSLPGKAWRILDLEAGIPEIHPETSELYTAHDLNLPELNAVSFTKGCYAGQEIVARTHFRATLKQHLYRGMMTGDLTYNTPVKSEDRSVGYIIDFEKSDSLSTVFLALIRDDAIDEALTVNQLSIILTGPPLSRG